MAKNRIPQALQMRTLKYSEAGGAPQDAVAQALRAQGRRAEAILLYEGRGEHPFLAEELQWAVQEGNTFHLLSVRRLGAPVTAASMRACAQEAERRGRWMDARLAWVDLADEEGLARVGPHLPATLRREPPAADDQGTAAGGVQRPAR